MDHRYKAPMCLAGLIRQKTEPGLFLADQFPPGPYSWRACRETGEFAQIVLDWPAKDQAFYFKDGRGCQRGGKRVLCNGKGASANTLTPWTHGI